MDDKIIVLMSGGLDSTVLFYKLYKEKYLIIPLFINYGQHSARKELSTLTNILPDEYKKMIKIIDLSSIYSESKSVLFKERNLWNDQVSDSDMYVPYRNLVIFSAAVAYAQTIFVNKVYAAFINTYYTKEIDAATEFLSSIKKLAKSISNVKIMLPFKNMSKLDVARLGLTLGAPITKTYSCQINSVTPCGACPNCVERIEALKKL